MTNSNLDRLSVFALARLVKLSRVLNSATEPDELLYAIISEAAVLTGSEVASILLLDSKTRELLFKADSLRQSELGNIPVPLNNSIAGRVFQTNTPMIVNSIRETPYWNPRVDETIGFQTHSILAVPMHDASSRPVGVLEAVNKKEGKFTDLDLETLSTLADMAGVAVKQAELIEDLRYANRQLNELDELKSNFIAIASHELRTPLSIILGYVSFLREVTDNPETASQLDSVLKAAVRLRSLIQDMLNLQYVDTKENRFTLSVIDLVELIRNLVASRDDIADAKQQHVNVRLPVEKLTILGDRGSFEVIVTNLLNNAVKFTGQGGLIEISLACQEEEAWLCVKDNGIGISQEHLNLIFTRFYQIEPHLSRRYEGLGLGLAVVKELAEMQGGRVWVNSRPGEGSEFYVALPLASRRSELTNQ